MSQLYDDTNIRDVLAKITVYNQSMWPTISEMRTMLSSPLFSNKYLGLFTKTYSTNPFPTNFGYMINSLTLPTFSYNAVQQYIGGVEIPVVNLFQQGQLDMTLYNTGKEYESVYKWGEEHYNQYSKAYGYLNDIYATFKIFEYDRTGNKVITHTFDRCTLYTYGGLQLSYEDSSQVETFQLSIQYQEHSVKLN